MLSGVVQQHLVSHPGATQDRHVDIEHQGLGQRRGPEREQPLLTRGRGTDFVSLGPQQRAKPFYQVGIIIDEEKVGHDSDVGIQVTPSTTTVN